MRRLVLAGLGTVSSLVLVFAYPTSHATGTGTGTGTTTSTGSEPVVAAEAPSDSSAAASSASASASASGSSASSGSAGTTYTGSAVDTRYGPVQVQITVAGGKVAAVDAVRYPSNDGHSQRINSYAVPTLNSEAVAAQSAGIDAVGGATITSNAYVQSLQSALDAAHL